MLMSTLLCSIALFSLTRAMAPGWKNSPEYQERKMLCFDAIFNVNDVNYESVKLECEKEADFDEIMFWHMVKGMGKRSHRMNKSRRRGFPEPEGEGEHWPEPEGEGEHWPEPEGEGEHWPEPEGEGEHWPEPEGEGEHWPEPEGEGEYWPEPEEESRRKCKYENGDSSEEDDDDDDEDGDDDEDDEENDDESKEKHERKMKCRKQMHYKHRRPPPSYATYKMRIGRLTKAKQMQYMTYEMCKGMKMGYLVGDHILAEESLKGRIEEVAKDNEPWKKQLLDRLDACTKEEGRFLYLCVKMGCKDSHKMYGKKYKCVEA